MQSRRTILLGFLCLALIWPARGSARTWRVWKDGSGDYGVIQDAVNAAAPGDTVLIGPGRYTESSIFPYDGEGIEGETFVGIDKDDLTLMGVDRDSVVIGPWEPNFEGFLPKGIAMQYQGSTGVRIESLTVRNVREGLRLGGVAWTKTCLVDSCEIGVVGLFDAAIEIDSCRMTNCSDAGGLFARGLSTMIRGSEIALNPSDGLLFINSQNASVDNCAVMGSKVGIDYQQGATGSIANCTIRNTPEVGIRVTLGSAISLRGTTLEGGEEGIVISASTLTGERNRLGPFTLHLMNVLGQSEVSFIRSDLLLGPTQSILVQGSGSVDPMMYLDLTNNWWGTTDAQEIADHIWDHSDDESINATVLFEPFRASTAPIKPESMSSFKALFGGQ